MRSGPSVDLTNLVFGKLKVMSLGGKTSAGNLLWSCKCECGKIILRVKTSLKDSPNVSCGCYHGYAKGRTTHGMAKTKTHSSWDSMIQRCKVQPDVSKRGKHYNNYAGRGITVWERWLKFKNFLEDMGEMPFEGAQLDRKDNDKGYYKDNCVWSTAKENNRNKRTNHLIEFNGSLITLAECSELTGINRHVLSSRLRLGWTVWEATNSPLHQKLTKPKLKRRIL